VSSASGTFTRKGRISKLLLGGAAIAPVALVAFDPYVVIANASLIFLRTFGIPKAMFLLPKEFRDSHVGTFYVTRTIISDTLTNKTIEIFYDEFK